MKDYFYAFITSIAVIMLGYAFEFHAIAFTILAFFTGSIVSQSFTINIGPKALKQAIGLLSYENLVRKKDEAENFKLKKQIKFWEEKYRIVIEDNKKLISISNELQERRLGFFNKALLSDLKNSYNDQTN